MNRKVNAKYYIENVEVGNFADKDDLPNSISSAIGFVGREDYLKDLQAFYNNGSRCFVLHGTGGVGKTALALQFAHEIATDFEAKILVEMQGMSKNPYSWRDTMFEIVRQFNRQIPTEISDAQLKGLFVQLVQSQKTLIVLDNAKDEADVAPLTAQVGACFIITSRNDIQLTTGQTIRLLTMSQNDAQKLLYSITPSVKFEGKSEDLAKLAGYLPMALKPLAKLLKKKFKTISGILREYNQKRLQITDTENNNLSIEASFALSYDALPSPLKEYWRKLAVFSADFDAQAASTVFGVEFSNGQTILEQLYDYSLIEEDKKSTEEKARFNLHDLARLFTEKQLSDEESFNSQIRHSFYYSLVLRQARSIRFDDRESSFVESLNLIDAEWSNIVSGQEWAMTNFDRDEEIAGLCVEYAGLFADIDLRLHPQKYIDWQKAGMEAARKIEDKLNESVFLGNISFSYLKLAEYRKSIKYAEQALKIAQETKTSHGVSNYLGNLGSAYRHLGEFKKAIFYIEQALEVAKITENEKEKSDRLIDLGTVYFELEDFQKAAELAEQSLIIARRINNQEGIRNSLEWLGNISAREHKYDKALAIYTEVLEIDIKIGNRLGEGSVWGNIGNIFYITEDFQKAINCYEKALIINQENGDRLHTGLTTGNLGKAYFYKGEKEKACQYWKEGVFILDAIESPFAAELRELLKTLCQT